MTKVIYALIFFACLISCGKAPKDKTVAAFQEEEITDGVYSAVLIPLNAKVTNEVTGEVKISKYGDDFRVTLSLRHAPPGMHEQHLYTGTVCPQFDADKNIDGYIDTEEARASLGLVIVPLDGDLSSQAAGEGIYPKGSYKYSNSTSYQLMLTDLEQPDDVINDMITKLKGSRFSLEKKVVVVYGRGTNLPNTVSNPNLPLVCGILTKTNESPQDDEDWRPPPPRRPREDNYRSPPPEPEPPQEPPRTEPSGGSWWDQWTQRWRRWSERVRDWWYNEE